MELVCPAGNLPALKAAVDHGADAVYVGFCDDTNARHFAGLNFDLGSMVGAIRYAHDRHRRVYLAINTYAQAQGSQRWQNAVDHAAELEIDALIVADIGVLEYACERWPKLRLHLSVQASATNLQSIGFYHREFGVQRVVLPRVLSLSQLEALAQNSPIAVETFGFGSLCVMVEGRCLLSSYATGESPNTGGACSPAQAVEWRDVDSGLETRLGGILIDRRDTQEAAGYPTLCKGRFRVNRQTFYALEEPTSLNTLELLPQLLQAGVAAIKIEGRQRSSAYVAQVTRVWRAAIDQCLLYPRTFIPRTEWLAELQHLSEGVQTTFGAYHRPWQ